MSNTCELNKVILVMYTYLNDIEMISYIFRIGHLNVGTLTICV